MTAIHYCWGCYGEVPRASGRCFYCGRQIAAPDDADEIARLRWALYHPCADVQLAAARTLGQRGEGRALRILWELARDDDVEVAAAARAALGSIDGAGESAPAVSGEVERSAPVCPVPGVSGWPGSPGSRAGEHDRQGERQDDGEDGEEPGGHDGGVPGLAM